MNYEEQATRYLRQSGRGIITYEEYCEKMKALYRHAYDRGYITREERDIYLWELGDEDTGLVLVAGDE